jgi:hypothetical protein
MDTAWEHSKSEKFPLPSKNNVFHYLNFLFSFSLSLFPYSSKRYFLLSSYRHFLRRRAMSMRMENGIPLSQLHENEVGGCYNCFS